MALLLLLHLRRAHPFLLHCRRLCSTFNSTTVVIDAHNSNYVSPSSNPIPFSSSSISKHTEPFEKKWKQLTVSLLSLRDRYAIDARLLSEKINSRQVFLNETINNLLVLPAAPPPPPPPPSYPTLPQEIIYSEQLKNINRLDRLMRLKDIPVRQDEMSAELTNSILTYLQEIIINFSDDPPLLGEEALKKWNEVTYSLTNLSFMRSKAEQFREGNKPTKQVRPAELNFGPVYNLWVKPPQLRSGPQCETIRLSPRASRTSPEFHC